MKMIMLALAGTMLVPGVALAQANPYAGGGSNLPVVANQMGKAQINNDYSSRVLLDPKNAPARQYAASISTGECLARRAGAKAGAMVGDPANANETYAALVSALRSRFSNCVDPAAVGAPMAVLNGALAEVLLRKENPALADHSTIDGTMTKTFVVDAQRPTLTSVARCVSAYSPGMAYRYLWSAPGTPDEARQLNSLYGQTPQCGMASAPSGVDAALQRSVVASALYHFVHRG